MDTTKTIKRLFTVDKGILALDDKADSADKRLKAMGISPSAQVRQHYKELFITTSDLNKYISGVILQDETLEQKNKENKSYLQILQEQGIELGIKVDMGLTDFIDSAEKYTQGLDNLDTRLVKYKNLGFSFAKWRSVFKVSETTPSESFIDYVTACLATYAGICLKNGIVPIVEPEVLHSGTHTLDDCYEVTALVLETLFEKLKTYNIDVTKIILKTNMITAGENAAEEKPAQVGNMTTKLLEKYVPQNIGGVVFLSGGLSKWQAFQYLSEIVKQNNTKIPVTFSFLRAQTQAALETWRGDSSKVADAQQTFIETLKQATNALKR